MPNARHTLTCRRSRSLAAQAAQTIHENGGGGSVAKQQCGPLGGDGKKPCATLGRLSRKAGVGEATPRFRVKSWWQRPLAQSVEIALEMRRIDGADDGSVHVRVAERKPKNELHRGFPAEQIVNLRPLPTFPLQPGLLSLRRSTLCSA